MYQIWKIFCKRDTMTAAEVPFEVSAAGDLIV